MLTVSKSSSLSQTASSLRQSAALSSRAFSHDNNLQQPHFQSRSSASKSTSFSGGAARQVNRLLVLQGRNAFAFKIGGNGTSSVTGVQQMHNGGAWEFFSNGRFRFTPAGLGVVARTDLFPIVGDYRSTNDRTIFSGFRTSISSTSRNSATIRGNIVAQNGIIRATVIQRVVAINAVVVNGVSFRSAIDQTVRIDMNMVRIA